jgi:uncharacterized NAD-dependent epimerase/dehydratase family protein
MATSVKPPYLLFLADAEDRLAAKTAFGLHYWRSEQCVGQLRFPECRVSLDLPDLLLEDAVAQGARTLVVGLAPAGGQLPQRWVSTLAAALQSGLDLASGLHTRLSGIPQLAELARSLGRKIHDVRYPTGEFTAGSSRRRSGKRLLAVGTDCAVGKMFTVLALEREMRTRGLSADFRATGQTGILIAGAGVAVDAVISDFVSGAAETLSPDNDSHHWDLIEGQGSLFHPSYAGVSLGLLHGSQPDALVLCHEAVRVVNGDFADLKLPSLTECAELNLRMARMVNPGAQLVGVSLNTYGLSEEEARRTLAEASDLLEVPSVDPVRTGVKSIVDRLDQQVGRTAAIA